MRKLTIIMVVFSLSLFSTLLQALDKNISITAENSESITYTVQYGNLEYSPMTFGKHVVNVPSMKGAQAELVPGHPILPVQGFLLQVPANAKISLEILDARKSVLHLSQIPSAPYMEIEDPLSVSKPAYRFDPAQEVYRSSSLWPERTVEITQDGFMRGRRCIMVGVHPLQVNPITGQAQILHEATIRIRYTESGAGASAMDSSTEKTSDPLFDKNAGKLFLNQRTASRFAKGVDPTMPIVNPKQAGQRDAKGETIKIYVKENGLYQFSYADFVSLGIDPSGIDPLTLKVANPSQEIPIYVEGEGDGTFDSGDFLVFYGEGVTGSKYTDINCYWITYDGAAGLRASTQTGVPGGTLPVPDAFPDTVTIEQNNSWWAAMPNWELHENWFWERLTATVTRSYSGTVTDPATGQPDGTIRSYFHGKTSTGTYPDHHTRVAINGTYVQDFTWDGQIAYSTPNNFTHSLLNNGSNTFAVNLPGDTGSVVDQQYFDRIELEYYRQYKASGNYLEFGAKATGDYEFQVPGFTSPDILVFDITTPENISLITGTTVSGSGSYTVSFEGNIASAGTQFATVTTGGFAEPEDVKLDEASALGTTANGADFIIITHEDLYDAALPLATRRNAQGVRTRVVKIDDVFDEFTGGVPDPMAIRSFLNYAYNNWESPAPLYVLLLGDSTVDYLGNLGTGRPVNLVPSYLAHTGSLGATPSDNPFFLLGTDVIPDFYTGRIPAEDAAYVDQIISKIITYEESALAPWHENIQYVADNNSTIFETMNEELVSLMPAGFTPDRAYIDSLGTAGTKTAIRNGFHNGRLIINYFGHGSVENWAGELVLQSSDIPSYTNDGIYPFVTAFNCLNGFFALTENDRYCLSEAVIRYPNKGSAASYGPTGYGYTSEHYVLSQLLWNLFFQEDIRLELGAATTLARVNSYATHGTSYEIVDTYHLFGDPTMQLKRDLSAIDSDEDGYTRDVDCDDLNDEIHPGAYEYCDGVDNNCIDGIDDGCVDSSIPIVVGTNVLGLAMDQTGFVYASDVVGDIEAQGGMVYEVYIWDDSIGGWRTYDPTFPIDDFPVSPVTGFIVRAGASSTWMVTGQLDMMDTQQIHTANGFTLVAVPSEEYADAPGLVSAMAAEGCNVLEMTRWDTATGGWETYDPGFPLYPFALDRQSGYFLKASGSCTFDLEP